MIHLLYKLLSSFRYEHIKADKDFTGPNIYVAGYPISGNSWIAYLITYIINCKYFDIDAVEWSPQRVPLIKYLSGNNQHHGSKIFKNLYKTHERLDRLPNSNKDVIVYVVRDPRDVSNSYFHRLEKIYSISNNEVSIFRRYIYLLSKILVPHKYRYRFIIRLFGFEWSNHVKKLFENKNIVLALYEDLVDNPISSLEKIIKNIDSAAWDKQVANEALENFSFKNLKKSALKSSTKITTDRVGTYGDWKNYFSDKDINFFEKEYVPIIKKIKKQRIL